LRFTISEPGKDPFFDGTDEQALKVALINKERNEKAIRPLRNLWGRARGLRRKMDVAAFQKWQKEELDPKIAALEKLAREYEDKIYQANQPPARRYELTPVQ